MNILTKLNKSTVSFIKRRPAQLYETLKHLSSRAEVQNNRTNLTLTLNDGKTIKTLKFNPHWLRFNCHSDKSQQSGSGQRLIDADTVPNNLSIEIAQVVDQDVHIEWAVDSNQPTTIIPVQYLINNYTDFDANSYTNELNFHTSTELKFFDYISFEEKNGNKHKKNVYEWLKQLAVCGVCVVRNVPAEDKMVKRLAEIIAPVQKTIYGEIFDVKVDENPINIAYSNAKLGFHMDLMYYESPPGLQFLHCLRFDEGIEGGESRFVDSFRVAEDFRRDHPQLFLNLTKLPATFKKIHFDRDRPVFMFYQRPHIVLNHRNKVTSVNWSPPFEGPLLNLTEDEMKAYYESYLVFSRYINEHKDIIEYRLKPGEVACFNNRRVLHARNSFKTNKGVRHFQGCYVNIDEFKSEVHIMENSSQGQSASDIKSLQSSVIKYGNHDFY